MISRHEFIEKTLYLIRKELSNKLPNEDTLENMINKSKELIKNIYERR
jgi:hypothetical protein